MPDERGPLECEAEMVDGGDDVGHYFLITLARAVDAIRARVEILEAVVDDETNGRLTEAGKLPEPVNTAAVDAALKGRLTREEIDSLAPDESGMYVPKAELSKVERELAEARGVVERWKGEVERLTLAFERERSDTANNTRVALSLRRAEIDRLKAERDAAQADAHRWGEEAARMNRLHGPEAVALEDAEAELEQKKGIVENLQAANRWSSASVKLLRAELKQVRPVVEAAEALSDNVQGPYGEYGKALRQAVDALRKAREGACGAQGCTQGPEGGTAGVETKGP